MVGVGRVVDASLSTLFEHDGSETTHNSYASQFDFLAFSSPITGGLPAFLHSRPRGGVNSAQFDTAAAPPRGRSLGCRCEDDAEDFGPRSGSCSRHASCSSSLSVIAGGCMTPLVWRLTPAGEEAPSFLSHRRPATPAGDDGGDAGQPAAHPHPRKRGVATAQPPADQRLRQHLRLENSDCGCH